MTELTVATFVAQTQAAEPAWWINVLPMVAIFAIFYFLLVAPMRKRQKELRKLIENLKRGDRVVTTGGLLGEVSAIEGSVVHLKLGENMRVRVAKSHIAGLEGEAESRGGQ